MSVLISDNISSTAATENRKRNNMSWAELKTCFWICCECKQCMRVPKVLPCLHSLCLQCLERCIEGKRAVSRGRLLCPVCKAPAVIPQRGVMAFATNIYIEQMQKSNNHVISKFGGRSIDECTCFLCSEFRATRQKIAEAADGQGAAFLSPDRSNNELKEKTDDKSTQHCSLHPTEDVLYFCFDCQQASCRFCIEMRHRDHRFEPIALAAQNARTLLKTTRNILNVRQKSNDIFVKRLEKYKNDLASQKTKALSDVDNCIMRMHEALDKVKDQLKSDVDRLYTKENNHVLHLLEELGLSQQQLSSVSGFLDAHEDHDHAEVIEQRFLITDRVNQLYAAEQRTNFPMELAFNQAIPGQFSDKNWLSRVLQVLKTSIVGDISVNRVLAEDFEQNYISIHSEINKGVMLANFSLVTPSQPNHEMILLADRTHRMSVINQQIAAPTAPYEIPLTKNMMPSISMDPNGYLYVLDRSNGKVVCYFGGGNVAKQTYVFPKDRCRPVRICVVGQTGGFVYIDAFSPSAEVHAFALRFVPRNGDRFDLILPIDRSMFSGDMTTSLPDAIPALASDKMGNVYVLDVDATGKGVIIAYSMSFGTVSRIVLESVDGGSRQRTTSQPQTVPLNTREKSISQSELESIDRSSLEGMSRDKGAVNAEFSTYLACCPHTTGTRQVVPPSSSSSSCNGVFAVADTARDNVRLYNIYGDFVCELEVPSPLEKIRCPRGVAFDHGGNLLLCDHGNSRLLLFDHSGRRLRGILAAAPPAVEELRHPADLVTVPGRYQAVVAEETTALAKVFDYSTLVMAI